VVGYSISLYFDTTGCQLAETPVSELGQR